MVVLLGLFANARKSQTLAHLKVSARGAQLYDGVYSCSIECQKSVRSGQSSVTPSTHSEDFGVNPFLTLGKIQQSV